MPVYFFFYVNGDHRNIHVLTHSFPTRRASDLPEKRGPYAGGVGYFSPDGSMDSCIVLRTAVVKDGVMHVQAGAGIVADSDPAYEQRECESKSGALIAAARAAIPSAAEAGYGDRKSVCSGNSVERRVDHGGR